MAILYCLRSELRICQWWIINSGFYKRNYSWKTGHNSDTMYLIIYIFATAFATSGSFCQNEGKQYTSKYSHSVQYSLDDLVNYAMWELQTEYSRIRRTTSKPKLWKKWWMTDLARVVWSILNSTRTTVFNKLYSSWMSERGSSLSDASDRVAPKRLTFRDLIFSAESYFLRFLTISLIECFNDRSSSSRRCSRSRLVINSV